jgi:hypothetical protein
VLDHSTRELFPVELARVYLGWQLTPQALHVVEAVASAPRPAGASSR